MFSTVYVACLLAASAFASPLQHSPRSFGSSYDNQAAQAASIDSLNVSPNGLSSSHSDSSSMSRNSGSTYGNMGGVGAMGMGGAAGFSGQSAGMAGIAGLSGMNGLTAMGGGGGFAGMSGAAMSLSQMSQQSISLNSVTSNFQYVSSMMMQMQASIAAGNMASASISQSVQMLAQYFQLAISQANTCGVACFGNQGQFGGVASSFMQSMYSFMSQVQTSYSTNYSQLLSPFQMASSSMSQFFSSISSQSSFNANIIPSGLPGLIAPIMPSVANQMNVFKKK